MRLCFYIDMMSGGGAERVMSILVNALSKEHNVYLITDTTKPILYHLDTKVRCINYMEGFPEVTKSLINKIWRRIWLLKQYRSIAKQIKPDVVISFKSQVNYDVILALFFSGIPVVCSEHTNILRKRPFSWRLRRNLLYPHASAITVLTKYDFNQACCRKWNTVHMPNPCIINTLDTKNQRKKVVFTAGRVDDWNVKGYDLLLKAWSSVCKKFTDWTLQIAGSYSENTLQILNKIAQENGCSNYKFLGYKSNVEEYMSSSAVYCLSSRIEGLPMGLIEAMNAECCCVAFDCITGPNEIIRNGYNGFLAEAENVDDLSSKLAIVMSDDKLRLSFASHARESLSRYSLDNVIKLWNDLFKKVIQ